MSKKISSLQKDVHSLSNKLSVFSRKVDKCNNEISSRKEKVVSNDVECGLRVANLHQNWHSVREKSKNDA